MKVQYYWRTDPQRGLESLKAAVLTELSSSHESRAGLLDVHWLFIHGPSPMNTFSTLLHEGATCSGSLNMIKWPQALKFSSFSLNFNLDKAQQAVWSQLQMSLTLEIFILFFPGGNRSEKSNWSFRKSTSHCKGHPPCTPADAETWIPCNLQNTTCFNTAVLHMDTCFLPIKLVLSEKK